MTIRIWSIETQEVVEWQKANDVITSLRFSPKGNKLVAGLYKGKCLVYTYTDEKLTFTSTINCKNRYGKYSDGRKVTGLHFANNNELLVTTGDNRIRLFNLDVFFKIE